MCAVQIDHPSTRWSAQAIGIALLGGLLTAPVTVLAASNTPLSIVVSILPQKYLVQRIGQQHVTVSAMAGAGHNPTTYEPTPKQITRLHNSDAYLCVGVPFEAAWIRPVINSNHKLPVFDIRNRQRLTQASGLTVTGHTEHDDNHGHHDALDPHVWTSPAQIKTVARHISAILSELDPAHTTEFAANLATLEQELDVLDQQIREQLGAHHITHFMVFHPAWGHFAKQYGLTQIAIEQNGKEPGARALTQLIAQARQHNIHTLFVQAQFNRRSADIIANSIGGNIVIVDPLAENVIDNLRRLVDLLTGREKS